MRELKCDERSRTRMGKVLLNACNPAQSCR